MNEDRTECGLYLVVEAGASATERLAAALGAAPIACVLIEAAPGEALAAASVRPLVEMARGRGAAALIAGDPQLARLLKADGVHLAWSKHLRGAYEEAREIAGDRSVVGVHAGKSRHDAMLLAERGADYIGFGVPAEVKDRNAARARRLELVSWWAEIFTVPCVAFDAETPEEGAELAAAGADFVGRTLNAGTTPAETAERVAAIYCELQRSASAA